MVKSERREIWYPIFSVLYYLYSCCCFFNSGKVPLKEDQVIYLITLLYYYFKTLWVFLPIPSSFGIEILVLSEKDNSISIRCYIQCVITRKTHARNLGRSQCVSQEAQTNFMMKIQSVSTNILYCAISYIGS